MNNIEYVFQVQRVGQWKDEIFGKKINVTLRVRKVKIKTSILYNK